MTLYSALLFAFAMVIFVASPGPGIFAVIGETMARGGRSATAMTIGITFGDLTYLLGALLGLGAMASTMGELFVIVRVIGGAWLVWLGISAWRAEVTGGMPVATSGSRKALLAGYLISISNPKVMVFYLALLPGFVDVATIDATGIGIVAFITVAVIVLVNLGYIWAAGGLARKMTTARSRRRFNRISGGLLILAGAYLMAS